MLPGGPLLVPVFPLEGALLFPRSQLPLHIFEPRYRDMVRDALAGDRLIVMVQPRDEAMPPALFDVGTLGHLSGSEELEDGRYNIILDGLSRCHLRAEQPTDTSYRRFEVDCEGFGDEEDGPVLASIQRAELEREARLYADALGYGVDWNMIGRLDDELLVNGIATVAPIDTGSKQALLEAPGLIERCDLLVQFMQFARMMPGGPDSAGTWQ